MEIFPKKRQIYDKIAWKLQKKLLIFAPAFKKLNDSIAQSVEHITFNDGVLGSSPSRVTNFVINKLKFLESNDSIAQSVEHITFNDGVLGSSPSRVTKGRVIYFTRPFFIFGHVEKR